MRPDLRGDDTGQALASDPVISAGRRAECVVALQEHPSHGCAAGDVGRADSSEGRTDVAVMARFGGNNPSDAALAQTALLALNQSALVPVGKVRPVVRNAWLLLEGEVEGRSQRHAAEDAVSGLPGIRGISNNILIESEIMAQRVSRKIDEAFIRSARRDARRIQVTARDHRIILSGSVRSGAEREEAESAAWEVPGVAEVVNWIRATAEWG